MADFAELGAELTNHLTEKHFDTAYDKAAALKQKHIDRNPNYQQRNNAPPTSDVTSSSRRRHRNQLPSPERDADHQETNIVRDLSPERSETSERVLRAYEAERDDPRRKPESVLGSPHDRRRNMSGYTDYPSHGASGFDQRPRSQPPRSRYDDDGDSDYDEREGRRYPRGGRGYRDDDYDREVIETERYKGVSNALVPARAYDTRRPGSQGARDDAYGPSGGVVTQYRRSGNDATTDVSRRTRDRGRDDRYDDRDRSESRSRSDSRDRGEGFKGKMDEYFDTSAKGLGAGIAGAVIGGLAGRQFGKEHKQRDIILGAIVGGLAANAAENKYNDWKEDKYERREREQGYDGRARSSVR